MFKSRTLTLAVLAGLAQIAAASDEPGTKVIKSIEELVVTGVRMDEPLNLSTDPKAPRQPLPAADGADYLKTIPGFSVIRKGGADGDPVLRGMAGSRLSMLVDGEMILGGCSNRMDPPTAYVFPEAFDNIQVIKGPQSVQHGPGNSAGVVLFERNTDRPEESGWNVNSSALGGSWGRHDEVLDATYSSPQFTVRAIGTNAAQDNFDDGAGNEIHSEYKRWTTQASLAWTPNDTTRFELSAAQSDGEAAYSDRGVDGSRFARDNVSLKFSKQNLTEHIESIEGQIYYNYVDHVMDNYSLRDVMPGARAVAMNPDRMTEGGRLSMTVKPTANSNLVLGFDTQSNEHTNRMSMNQNMVDYRDLARIQDSEFSQQGLFAEYGLDLDERQRIVTGLRVDNWEVRDSRERVALNMMMNVPNPTFGESREDTLESGFFRYERILDWRGTNFFAGIGHSERFPDYWEMIAKESAASVSALDIESEKTTQIDVGLIYSSGRVSGSASVFYSEIDDFLMIETGYLKLAMMGNVRSASIVRNVDARTWGAELDGQYEINPNWRLSMTLASVRGANDTNGHTLPQMPPLETRLGLHYDNADWSAGLLWRGITAQDRVDIGRGNIVGQDFGPSDSANVLSLNGGWRAMDNLLVTGGIDNLLDEEYAEHISRAGAVIPGFDQISRVNEPGRTFWLKAQLTF